FAEIKPGSMSNETRLYFIDRETTEKLIAAAPNAEWRLIIALARWGGLRTPSEPLALTWDDVKWDQGKLRIDSPKTGERWIPLFPELRPHLDEAWYAAETGAKYVITKSREPGVNWRTTFKKIITRAGLTPWERLFQNLRASRETELAADHPLHMVTASIANSAPVAAKHYLKVTDADFDRAAKRRSQPKTPDLGADSVQNSVQTLPAAKEKKATEVDSRETDTAGYGENQRVAATR